MSKSNQGFSLLEVLIALAILAIAATALISSTGQNIRQQAYLKDKTLTSLIAENTITEMRVTRSWLDIGTINKTTDMGGQKWNITIVIKPTEDADMRRADVTVASETSKVKTTLTGYLGKN